jgi:hypothetical protein
MPRVLEQSLWVLAVAKDKANAVQMSAGEISGVLCDVFEISATRQSVHAALKATRGLAHKREHTGRTFYSIMQKGRDALRAAGKPSVLLIEPESAFTGLRELKSILATLAGDVLVCDPYVDATTLDFLALIPKDSAIRLLARPPQKGQLFRRHFAAYRSERGNLEVRVDLAARLHDRYVIADGTMYLLGQSLNGIGKKQTFVVAMGPDIREQTRGSFESLWKAASPFA